MENKLRYTITLDDDPTVCKFISRAMGINSIPFTSSSALLKRCESYDPVAFFVDIHLDFGDCGLDVIPHLRSIWTYTPIIVVTNDPNDDLVGNALATGANDFLHKPINAVELMGRLHARIREMNARRENDVLNIGDLRFSISKFSIERGEKIAYLPRLEAELLGALLQNRDMVLTKEELKRRLWGRIVVSDNTLDKKISGVRKALADVGSELQIKTVYGRGVTINYQKTQQVA